MSLHQVTGRFLPGLLLASSTMILWGVLPLILEGTLLSLDPITITWFRFFFATVVLAGWLAGQRQLPRLRELAPRGRGLLAVATLFLAVNYLTYLMGLERTNAAASQVLIQAAPLLLALGGIVVFRESFARLQWLGLAVLVLGMGAFFADQIHNLVESLDRYLHGTLLIGVASVTWAVYGLAQKQLLLWLPSQAIMLCIYAGSALLFAPGASPQALLELDGAGWLLLLLASLNTLLGYGTFAASLEHWEAARVSAILALTPLATLVFSLVASAIWPGLVDSGAASLGAFAGAAVVVVGSLLVAYGQPTRTAGGDAEASMGRE
jgi:drug/metabolite transporter (DMT)-like permease